MFWLRALAAEGRGDVAEAERAAAWVIRLDGRDPWAAVHAGELYLRIGAVPEARDAAAAALALDPELPQAHQLSGRVALAERRFDDALAAFDRAPGLPVTAGVLEALLATHQLERADAVFAQWSPTEAEWLPSARLALRLGQAPLAAARALEALDRPVEGPEAAEIALEAAERTCDLRPLYGFASAHHPRVADARWRPVLRAIYTTAGDGAALALALRADPDPEPYAALLVAQGRADEALAWLGDAAAPEVRGRIAVRAGTPAAVAYAGVEAERRAVLLADDALSRGDVAGALAVTDGLPTSGSVGWVRAGALAAAGRVDEAVAVARDSAEDLGRAAVREAQVRALVGDTEGERRALSEALELEPCAPEVLVPLARDLPPCEAAPLLARAAGLRLADAGLADALGRAHARCAGLPDPR